MQGHACNADHRPEGDDTLSKGWLQSSPHPGQSQNPKGPKIEKIQDRPPGLKFSIEIENFNLDTQQAPIFCGEF